MKERQNSVPVTFITLGDLIDLSTAQIDRRAAGEEPDKHQEHNDRKAAKEPLQIVRAWPKPPRLPRAATTADVHMYSSCDVAMGQAPLRPHGAG